MTATARRQNLVWFDRFGDVEKACLGQERQPGRDGRGRAAGAARFRGHHARVPGRPGRLRHRGCPRRGAGRPGPRRHRGGVPPGAGRPRADLVLAGAGKPARPASARRTSNCRTALACAGSRSPCGPPPPARTRRTLPSPASTTPTCGCAAPTTSSATSGAAGPACSPTERSPTASRWATATSTSRCAWPCRRWCAPARPGWRSPSTPATATARRSRSTARGASARASCPAR